MNGSSAPVTRVAVDAGSLLVKVAVVRGAAEPEVLCAEPVAGSEEDGLAAALAGIREQDDPGEAIGADVPVRIAVPDAWLDGSADGGRRQEEFRRIAEDEFGLTAVSWAGQMAAAAALAASQPGSREPGRYLVCDVGGTGVRTAVCESDGGAVREVAVHNAPGGGWRDFDAAVRTAVGCFGLTGWHESAMAQDKRARRVFDQVKSAPEFRGARVYSLADADARSYELTAGQAEDCFAPTADRIRAGTVAVLDGGRPSAVVLVGGLSWFPLADAALAEAAGMKPLVLGPEAAVRGALVLDAAPCRMPPVSLPVNQIRNGLLEEARIELPWEAQFAPADDEPLILDGPELILDIGVRRAVVDVPGLRPGAYRVGVRPSWSGSAVLVLRGDQAGADPASMDVHVVPLDIQEMTR